MGTSFHRSTIRSTNEYTFDDCLPNDFESEAINQTQAAEENLRTLIDDDVSGNNGEIMNAASTNNTRTKTQLFFTTATTKIIDQIENRNIGHE
ncbi:unnamed protein product [Didymodactylos carnosus]|uniref:Uncharacterized protein n=1 Tax=Didymodactylos carnosus TaxID=1234261 RepID=A0A814KHT6_9BILA|nr:unnamed protein product [Didymodactylos carnosus]CAF1378142.1 unnamed protein product [Didymodactylos carnosus]CAF3820565.1 unnamed protein product [Didymodactylos carnosus]CAF4186921.1 unnamed protein product [Didymodactylos carnosus]